MNSESNGLIMGQERRDYKGLIKGIWVRRRDKEGDGGCELVEGNW